jgi:hypothetical protein
VVAVVGGTRNGLYTKFFFVVFKKNEKTQKIGKGVGVGTMLSLQTVVRDVVLWLLDVRERVRKLEGEVAMLRGEVARMHKEVVKLRNKVRYEELVAKVRYEELLRRQVPVPEDGSRFWRGVRSVELGSSS